MLNSYSTLLKRVWTSGNSKSLFVIKNEEKEKEEEEQEEEEEPVRKGTCT